MRRTHDYTASNYVADSGFPLSWMCRCICTGRAAAGAEQEAEEYHQRNKPKPNTIIGRPAGRDAYHNHSAMRYGRQNQPNAEAGNTTGQQAPEEASDRPAPAEPNLDSNATTTRSS